MSFPKQKCPYCNSECEADWVDADVTFYQCSPYMCNNCGASEIGFHCDDLGFDRELIDEHHRKYHKSEYINGKFKITIEKDFEVPKSSKITQEEFDKGWYKPNSPLADTVNTFNGKFVDHETALELYKLGLLDDKGEV